MSADEGTSVTVGGGRFRDLQLLGRGHVGSVYAAFDAQLERRVAVKVVRPELAAGPMFSVWFRREAQALARLRHPNLVQVLGVSEPGAEAFLVMELLEGETLAKRLTAGLPQPEFAVDVASQVAEGLAALHAGGLLHRDVKPESVFLLPNGLAKLGDFGLVRFLTPTTKTDRSVDLVSAYGHLAPEQFHGSKPTASCDVYALGALLYRELTGQPPNDAVALGRLLDGKPVSRPVPASIRAPTVPPTVDQLLIAALEQDPAKRQINGRAFGDALRVAAPPGWITDVAAKLAQAPAPLPRRGRLAAAAAVAAVLALGGFGLRGRLPALRAWLAPAPTAPALELLAGPFVYPRSAGADLDVVLTTAPPGGPFVVDGRPLAVTGQAREGAGYRVSATLSTARSEGCTVALPGVSGSPSFRVATGSRLLGRLAQADRVDASAVGPRDLVPALPEALRRRVLAGLAEPALLSVLQGRPESMPPTLLAPPVMVGDQLMLGDSGGQVRSSRAALDQDFAVAATGPATVPSLAVVWRDPAANFDGVTGLCFAGGRVLAYAGRTSAARLARLVTNPPGLAREYDQAARPLARKRFAPPAGRWNDGVVVIDPAAPASARGLAVAHAGDTADSPYGFQGHSGTLVPLAAPGDLVSLEAPIDGPGQPQRLWRYKAPTGDAAGRVLGEPLRRDLRFVSHAPAPLADELICLASAALPTETTATPSVIWGLSAKDPRLCWRFLTTGSVRDSGLVLDQRSGYVTTADGRSLYALDARGRKPLAPTDGTLEKTTPPAPGDLVLKVEALPAPGGPGRRFLGAPVPLQAPDQPGPPRRFFALLARPLGGPLRSEVSAAEIEGTTGAPKVTPLGEPFVVDAPPAGLSRGARRDDATGLWCAWLGTRLWVLEPGRPSGGPVLLRHDEPVALRHALLQGNVAYFVRQDGELRCVAFSPLRLPPAAASRR